MFLIVCLCPTMSLSYLAPDDAVTQLLGPFDEDVLCHSTVKGGVRPCFVACDGWILEKHFGFFTSPMQ